MDSTGINIIGLLFDVLGVIGLFIYGMPAKHNQDGVVVKVMEGNEDEESFNKLKLRSNISLGLIVIGFGLQIVASSLFYISPDISTPESYEDTTNDYNYHCCCWNYDHE